MFTQCSSVAYQFGQVLLLVALVLLDEAVAAGAGLAGVAVELDIHGAVLGALFQLCGKVAVSNLHLYVRPHSLDILVDHRATVSAKDVVAVPTTQHRPFVARKKAALL